MICPKVKRPFQLQGLAEWYGMQAGDSCFLATVNGDILLKEYLHHSIVCVPISDDDGSAVQMQTRGSLPYSAQLKSCRQHLSAKMPTGTHFPSCLHTTHSFGACMQALFYKLPSLFSLIMGLCLPFLDKKLPHYWSSRTLDAGMQCSLNWGCFSELGRR